VYGAGCASALLAAIKEPRLHLRWLEIIPKDTECNLLVEGLAGKHIQEDGVGVFGKMGRDVGCFNQLHERIALCMPGSEMDDSGRSVGHHVDRVHK